MGPLRRTFRRVSDALGDLTPHRRRVKKRLRRYVGEQPHRRRRKR